MGGRGSLADQEGGEKPYGRYASIHAIFLFNKVNFALSQNIVGAWQVMIRGICTSSRAPLLQCGENLTSLAVVGELSLDKGLDAVRSFSLFQSSIMDY